MSACALFTPPTTSSQQFQSSAQSYHSLPWAEATFKSSTVPHASNLIVSPVPATNQFPSWRRLTSMACKSLELSTTKKTHWSNSATHQSRNFNSFVSKPLLARTSGAMSASKPLSLRLLSCSELWPTVVLVKLLSSLSCSITWRPSNGELTTSVKWKTAKKRRCKRFKSFLTLKTWFKKLMRRKFKLRSLGHNAAMSNSTTWLSDIDQTLTWYSRMFPSKFNQVWRSALLAALVLASQPLP